MVFLRPPDIASRLRCGYLDILYDVIGRLTVFYYRLKDLFVNRDRTAYVICDIYLMGNMVYP